MSPDRDLQNLVGDAIKSDLRSIDSRRANSNYRLWEHKTLNIHRGVILLHAADAHDASTLLNEIRAIVAEEFSHWLSWLRGFGYGVVISAKAFPRDAVTLVNVVDTYNQWRGVFQWLVYIADDPRQGFGLHMWAEGYLSPAYTRIVERLRARGIDCPSFVRDKGAYFAFLESMGKLGAPTFKVSD